MFLPLFWAYVVQPDNHMGWTTSMPFASIYSMYPRTNQWNFRKKILRIDSVENLTFLCRPFWIFSFNFFFLLYPYSNLSLFMWFQGWDEILMITLISSKKLGVYRNMNITVPLADLFSFFFWKNLKTPRRQFEINWPLVVTVKCSYFWINKWTSIPTWHLIETIQGGKLFKGGNYSRGETID